MNTTTTTNATLQPIIDNLESLFSKFNNKFFESELSKPVITLTPKGRKQSVGWCTSGEAWQDKEKGYYEINICPEYIHLPIEDVCEVLLHEMIHLYNAQNGIQDCSRSTQYHNKHYKESAENRGLMVEKHDSRGWAKTSLKPETLEYIKALDLSAFDLFRKEKPNIKGEKKSSTQIYHCPDCDLPVRATSERKINCGICGRIYVLKEKRKTQLLSNAE